MASASAPYFLMSYSREDVVMRVDGADPRRLTENGYCDYQPRWGL
jgi:hypothetical protein